MERLFDRLERWLGPVLAALLAFITIGVFIQVVLRYVFAMSFLWGEELSLFAFIWCIFLGTAICSVRHSHFSFDMFHGLRGRAAGDAAADRRPVRARDHDRDRGHRLAVLEAQRGAAVAALGITLFVPTIVIPLSGLLMTIVCLMDIAAGLPPDRDR